MLGDMRILRKIVKPTATPVAVTPYTILAADMNVYVDSSGNPCVVNLPPATGSGRMLVIKKVDTGPNAVTIHADTTGTPDTIDGDAEFPLVYPWASITLQDWTANAWAIQ